MPHYLKETVFYHGYEKHFLIKKSEPNTVMTLKWQYR
jgi:hypothetical protein